MESSHRLSQKEINTNQYVHKPCLESPRKVALISVGIITMIGSAIAAGLLYSTLGNISLSCLAAAPIGLALILIGVRQKNPIKKQANNENAQNRASDVSSEQQAQSLENPPPISKKTASEASIKFSDAQREVPMVFRHGLILTYGGNDQKIRFWNPNSQKLEHSLAIPGLKNGDQILRVDICEGLLAAIVNTKVYICKIDKNSQELKIEFIFPLPNDASSSMSIKESSLQLAIDNSMVFIGRSCKGTSQIDAYNLATKEKAWSFTKESPPCGNAIIKKIYPIADSIFFVFEMNNEETLVTYSRSGKEDLEMNGQAVDRIDFIDNFIYRQNGNQLELFDCQVGHSYEINTTNKVQPLDIQKKLGLLATYNSQANKVQIWSLKNNQIVKEFELKNALIDDAIFSDNELIVCGTELYSKAPKNCVWKFTL
jgi:WD40 repeat protein